jgi:AAA domain
MANAELLADVEEFRVFLKSIDPNKKRSPKLRPASPTLVVKDANDVLNAEQRAFVDGALGWFGDRAAPQYCLLTGGAGTGKTFAIVQCLKLLGISPYSVAICAPTVAAARNVANGLAAAGMEGFRCVTAHSLFKMRRRYVEGKGLIFESVGMKAGAFDNIKLMIADEALMLGGDICEVMARYTPKSLKVLLVGDSYQLPPVIGGKARKQKIDDIDDLPDPFKMSPVLGIEGVRHNLTQTMRQDGGKAPEFGKAIRGAIDSADKIMRTVWATDSARKHGCKVAKIADPVGYDETMIKAGSAAQLESAFVEANQRGVNAKFLAWTNQSVDRANARCFNALFPDASHDFVEGALVKMSEHWRNGGMEVIIPATVEGTVHSESLTTVWILNQEVECHQLLIDFVGDGLMPVITPTKAGQSVLDMICSAIKHRGKKGILVTSQTDWNHMAGALELPGAPKDESVRGATIARQCAISRSQTNCPISDYIFEGLLTKKIRLNGGEAADLCDMIKSPFAELCHGYASTVHKAQGATYDETYFLNDLQPFWVGGVKQKDDELIRNFSGVDPREALRLMYVAMSRHRDRVMFCDVAA